MSFSLWARPAPTSRPDPEHFYQLKWALSERGLGLLSGDGSLRGEPVLVTKELLGAWLKGVRDGGTTEIREEAERLLALLDENPQGVELWIGDHDDA